MVKVPAGLVLGASPRAIVSLARAVRSQSNGATGEFLSPHLSSAMSAGWDFSRVPIHSISRPGDAAEREADAMADKALSNTPSKMAGALAHDQGRPVSEYNDGRAFSRSPMASRLGTGRPLDSATRDCFEPLFQCNFGQVRVHDRGEAHHAAAEIGARAFTVGQNIAFGTGEYAPGTDTGRRLIAHELAHTLQERIKPTPSIVLCKSIPGWNFRPIDFLRLKESGRTLTMAADSGFFPASLQENLLNTLKFVLGPAILPPATDGINALDLFHGHLVIKKDPGTTKESKAAEAKGDKFNERLSAVRDKALGGAVSVGKGYPLTDKNLVKYQEAIGRILPSFGTLLEEVSKMRGAAVMYHTYEFINPHDLEAQGKKMTNDDPRRHYVTPLDTNRPQQYTPPSPETYEKEFTHITKFSFLVDDKGEVHVRPFDTRGAFTSLELSTITGTTYPEPLDTDR